MSVLENLTGRRDNDGKRLVTEWSHQGKINIYTIYIPVINPSQYSYIKAFLGNLSHVFDLICNKRIHFIIETTLFPKQ